MINLLYEEYEALKLSDFDHYTHQEASVFMEVSRPTFTRIYSSALQKIAQAFVEGRGITIEGGHVYFDSTWYYCDTCSSRFNNPFIEETPQKCPLCGSWKIKDLDATTSDDLSVKSEKKVLYRCENCGTEKEKKRGAEKENILCDSCGNEMILYRDHNCGNNACL